jgi:hypothetical protein
MGYESDRESRMRLATKGVLVILIGVIVFTCKHEGVLVITIQT